MIWCVEDETSIREIEVYTLQVAGFEAVGIEDGGKFWQMLARETPELLLLDVMLPGEDGISILKKLRARPQTHSLPIILATARGEEYDRVCGLDLGADDYLVKPFSMLELVARVKALLRRTKAPEAPKVLKAGGVELNPLAHTLTVDGAPVALTYKEFALLKLLMEHPQKVFTRDELLSCVWETDFSGETRTVDVHVRTLRQKLGEWGHLVETVRHVGYRLEQ